MFKLPQPPSPMAETHELADFAELLAWRKNSASIREILAYLGRIDDNDHNTGCDDDDDENAEIVDEVMNEIERREEACSKGYPFELDPEGTVLRHKPNHRDHREDLYRYLLLSTRLDMSSNRMHAKIDGTQLFEHIAAQVLKHYLGGNRARSFVFGTATSGNFQNKVSDLCNELGEGVGFNNRYNTRVRAQDDKLDAVAWIPFSDKRSGQLIAFAQCKTGTNWREALTMTNPDAFIKKWIDTPFLVNPLRFFCITEAANRSRWAEICIDGGVLLDRCRVVDFCEKLDSDLLTKMRQWTQAAIKAVKASHL